METIALVGSYLIVTALLVERYFHDKQIDRERKTVINALLSRTPQEFTTLETVASTEKTEPVSEDLVPMDEVGEDDFEKLIKGN